MPGCIFGGEFKLKLDYIEEIEKLGEQVKAKNDETRPPKSTIEEAEEARKAAETKNEMQFEISSKALSRVSGTVINSVSRMENKLQELEKRRIEDSRYHVMADHVIAGGKRSLGLMILFEICRKRAQVELRLLRVCSVINF